MDKKQRGLIKLAAGFLCYAVGFMVLLPYTMTTHRTSVWPPLISIIAGVILILMGVVDCSL